MARDPDERRLGYPDYPGYPLGQLCLLGWYIGVFHPEWLADVAEDWGDDWED